MNLYKISGNNWINLFKVSFVGIILISLIAIKVEGLEIPIDKYEKRSFYFFFFVFLPLSISGSIYYLTVLVHSLALDVKNISIKKFGFFTYRVFHISTVDISNIEIKNGSSTVLLFSFKNNCISKIETLGLLYFEGKWIEPPYNQFMPSNPKSRVAFKIAYNISKKYGIPFKSEFIDE